MIPVSRPYLPDESRKFLIDAYDSTWISSLGEYIEKATEEFRNFTGASAVSLVSNGTIALSLALQALDLPVGSKVIVPNLTFAAVVNAVISQKLEPVFVDVNRSDYQISLGCLNSALQSEANISAIIVVNSYGIPSDLEEIRDLVKSRNIKIIEDCAEAHGAMINGKMVGSFGDIATYSFYGNKIITSGEGGAITSNIDTLIDTINVLRDHAMSKTVRYFHERPGTNARITNLQAAILYPQIALIQDLLSERDQILARYASRLNDVIQFPIFAKSKRAVNWLTSGVLKKVEYMDLARYLDEHGIQTRPFFAPLNTFPYCKDFRYYTVDNNSEFLRRYGISLPTYNGITTQDVDLVCSKILDYAKNN